MYFPDFSKLFFARQLQETGDQLTIVALSIIFVLSLHYVLQMFTGSRGFRYTLSKLVQNLPFVSSYVRDLRQKIVDDIERDINKELAGSTKIRTVLPPDGSTCASIIEKCTTMKQADSNHTSKMSGAIYVPPESEAFRLCSDVYSMFAHTNPLHGDAFPAVCQMESDIVSMTATLLGATCGDGICGNLTSGGTESILSAIRTTRNYMRSKKRTQHPEMIVAVSAHAAVYKAAEYFNIKLVLIGTDSSGRMSMVELKQKMNRNVILVYASAPGYPHGCIDPVEEIAACVKPWQCCLHVDACLGGFVLPFASSTTLAVRYSAFDFKVPEVTSMSVDTHKYGCAQKGSSVVLYRNRELRKFQYTAVSSWTGGMYISPTQAGSRSGGIIAQTWAAMMYFGRSGYVAATEKILDAALRLRHEIQSIPVLEIIGHDPTMVVAWKSASPDFDVYILNDFLCEMGWHLSVLHSPPALHLCITTANVASITTLVADIHTAVKLVQSGKVRPNASKASIYGMGNRMSNTTVVDDLLKDIQDIMDPH